MITKIVKRDGRIVPYDNEKIAEAIFKAAQSIGGNDKNTATYIAKQVEAYLENIVQKDTPSVEEIQDAVEKVLIENGHAQTAKAFILYRGERTRIRDSKERLTRDLLDNVIFGDTDEKTEENNVKRDNANVDGNSPMGTMLQIGSETSKSLYCDYVLKPEHAKAHKEGWIHIHDLDFYPLTMTCCQIEIGKLLKGGFSTGHGFLREPSNIMSATAQVAIAIQANQNDQHGGQSVPDFDYGLAPYVAKSYKKAYLTNLSKILEIEEGIDNPYEDVKEIIAEVEEKTGLSVQMYGNNGLRKVQQGSYMDAEREALYGRGYQVDAEMQAKARRMADREIRKETYQAMEAFIHNLNTMHSRAGAQVEKPLFIEI